MCLMWFLRIILVFWLMAINYLNSMLIYIIYIIYIYVQYLEPKFCPYSSFILNYYKCLCNKLFRIFFLSVGNKFEEDKLQLSKIKAILYLCHYRIIILQPTARFISSDLLLFRLGPQYYWFKFINFVLSAFYKLSLFFCIFELYIVIYF